MLSAALALSLVLLILLLLVAISLALFGAAVQPARVAGEFAALRPDLALTGGRAVAVVLAGALPLPAALFALWRGVGLLRFCRGLGCCFPAGARAMRDLGAGFAVAVLLGFAAEPVQGLLIAGREGLAWSLARFDPSSDSLGLFILALIVALVGQSQRAGEH